MKFIISTATLVRMNQEAADITEVLIGTRPDVQTIVDVTDKANCSVINDGENVTVEISDEGLFKYMALYLKIARVVAPIIKLFTELRSDIDEVIEFYNESK